MSPATRAPNHSLARRPRAWATMACLAAASLTATACATAPPAVVQSLPAPETVSKTEPGGNATDPQMAALIRLIGEGFGTKTDRFGTLRLRLPDWGHWTRVRFWGFPTRAAFRYGDEHYAVAALFYSRGEPDDTPKSCMERFIKNAVRRGGAFGAKLGDLTQHEGHHLPRLTVLNPAPPPPPPPSPPPAAPSRPATAARARPRPSQQRVVKPMMLATADAEFATMTNRDRWVTALAAYHSWPGTCLLQGFAVKATPHDALARAAVDRWVREGAGRLIWERGLWQAPVVQDR